MKLISWNVNGLRACLTHDFATSLRRWMPTSSRCRRPRCSRGRLILPPRATPSTPTPPRKKGYSGTACWCKTAPLAVTTGIGREEHDHEGRVLTLEYPGFYLVNCYTPNSQDG